MEIAPYLELARQLFQKDLPESDLRTAVASLPPLTEELLAAVTAEAEACGPVAPRHGWALLAVADAAAGEQADLRLRARAAWELARAANRWFDPGRAQRAAGRARTHFQALDDRGWVAAAVWQAHALPWAHPNFPEVVAQLERALAGLEAAGLDALVPCCRRDLGFAYLLVAKREQGLAAISATEAHFREQQMAHEVGRTLVLKATALRRLGRFDDALETVAAAISLLADSQSVDFHFARFRRAALQTLRGVAYDEAEATLRATGRWFRDADIPLMEAQCHSLLERLYLETGRLPDAARALEIAREIYRQFDVVGMQADNYLDSGRVAQAQAAYGDALVFYEEAQARYEQLQIPYMVAVSLMYRGDIYGVLGRHQEALASLEEAHTRFEEMGSEDRRSECALYLAGTWLDLNRPEKALARLEAATEVLLAAGRTFFLVELYAARAEARFRLGEGEEALALLREAAAHLPPGPALPGQPYLQRLQGEFLVALERPAEALPLLQEALQQQEEMGLLLSTATTQVALGECFLRLGRPVAAREAWEAALATTREAEPELAWRARAGLARLAAEDGEKLEAYRRAVAALSRLRRWFWQPAVAGAYLHRPQARPLPLLDEAVALAARLDAPEQALRFIEAGKAQTLLRRSALATVAPAALAVAERPRELVAEIRWLRQQIEASVRETPGFLRPAGERRLRARLQERLEEYESVLAQLQRRRVRSLAEAVPPLPGEFDAVAWRRRAREAVGDGWVAVDYYLAGDILYGILLTPAETRLFQAGIDPFTARVLDQWTRGRPPAGVARPEDLERLSRVLLPAGLEELLAPATHLILAPHGSLHHLPWPALSLPGGRLLVEAAVPSLIPSLAVVEAIWQRTPEPGERRDGLLLAISTFAGGRREPLPEVKDEAEFLAGTLGDGGVRLLEEKATWERLQALAGEGGLGRGGAGHSPFSFWHIATHAFHDSVSGRLSGIALYERDLWLDELWQLAPLPPLVMLSACNGSRGLSFPGDEQLGLASTCLAAGARQVVGSLWPVLDPAAAALTRSFYRHYDASASPAQALASAQREAIAAGRPPAEWASFVCTGTPSPPKSQVSNL